MIAEDTSAHTVNHAGMPLHQLLKRLVTAGENKVLQQFAVCPFLLPCTHDSYPAFH
jgi:hypothetical protein